MKEVVVVFLIIVCAKLFVISTGVIGREFANSDQRLIRAAVSESIEEANRREVERAFESL